MLTGGLTLAWAAAVLAAPLRLSSEAWDLAPQGGRADAVVVDERRADSLPEFRFAAPAAPVLPAFSFLEPHHLDGTVDRIMWSMAARVQHSPDRELRELPEIARKLHARRPDAFALAPMPREQLGVFTIPSAAEPYVRFSTRLDRLRRKNVRSDVLAAVAAHETDHIAAWLEGDRSPDLGIEERAFEREAAYLRLIGVEKIHRLLEKAAEDGDTELVELYANEALILEASRLGLLRPLIQRAYAHLH